MEDCRRFHQRIAEDGVVTSLKKGFTLIETVIVLVIIGILWVVLVESYTTISGVAFRIQQEKNLSEESLMITQILQSITDTASIDYEKYDSTLADTQGFVDTLYLTWGQRSGASIFATGECLPLEWAFPILPDGTYPNPTEILSAGSGCHLILFQDGRETPLFPPHKFIISEAMFKIIPFDSEERYFNAPKYENQILLNEVAKPAFWLFIHLYSPFYQPVGKNAIDQPLQLFFNLNG